AGIGSLGQLDQHRQSLFARRAIALELSLAQDLAVDHVVAVPAPGIEHHRALPGALVKQPGRCGKAFGADVDRLGSLRDDLITHGVRSSSISPAVALAEPTTPGTPAPGWVPAPTM